MTTTTRSVQDLTVDDHFLTVPLVWGDAADTRTIDIHAAVVTRPGGDNLPYLVFLQGGPGNAAPTPFHQPTEPNWLDDALAHYRVVMLDQRGTGKSTPVGDSLLELGDEAAAEYITHLRADSIVRDAEAMREHLGAATWNILGQSFGGFTTIAYLSTDAASIDNAYITGGLTAVGRTPDDVYSLCYDKMQFISEQYYRRFPEHRDRMRRLVDLAAAGKITLPTGEVLSVSRLRSIGAWLGSDHGWQAVWSILDAEPGTNAIGYDIAAAMPFGGRNPLYYLFHESSYADGHATNWSAERTEPQSFKDDVTLFTGEHVRREWAQTVPAFQPWQGVVDRLAGVEWPKLYDAEALAASDAHGAAAIYQNDVFVPVEYSLETAAMIPGVHAWVTSEHEHSGLRTGRVLPRLIELVQHRRLR